MYNVDNPKMVGHHICSIKLVLCDASLYTTQIKDYKKKIKKKNKKQKNSSLQNLHISPSLTSCLIPDSMVYRTPRPEPLP